MRSEFTTPISFFIYLIGIIKFKLNDHDLVYDNNNNNNNNLTFKYFIYLI